MQTFVPYQTLDLGKQAGALDSRRLGKQRVEAFQILTTLYYKTRPDQKGISWGNHPAVLMWESYDAWLYLYLLHFTAEWRKRGFADAVLGNAERLWKSTKGKPPGFIDQDTFKVIIDDYVDTPWWWGHPRLHASHRQALLVKDGSYYNAVFGEPIPEYYQYIWPCTHGLFYAGNIYYIDRQVERSGNTSADHNHMIFKISKKKPRRMN